jgi:signal peptidase I
MTEQQDLIQERPAESSVVEVEVNPAPPIEQELAGVTVEESPAKPDEHHKSAIREYFESAVVTVIMALFGMTFIIQAVKVPTGSMENNILIGDHLLVNKFVFAANGNKILSAILPYREVRRGDVIVFKYPQNPEVNYVKRCIGLPGDTVEVKGESVLINGQELPEHRRYARNPGFDANDSALEVVKDEPRPDDAKYTVYWEASRLEQNEYSRFHGGELYAVNQPFAVPERSYFAMGDNRDDSEDSRFWGTVPRENIVGRALLVYWSYDERAAMKATNPLTKILRFTRWRRTGTLIR